MLRWSETVAVFTVFLLTTHAAMTYDDAVQNAMQGRADDEVLAAFYREHVQAEKQNDKNRLKGVKINLGALLLNLANKNSDQKVFVAMYKECEKISLEVLDIEPGNIEGEDNLRNARNNLRIRSGSPAGRGIFDDEDDDEEDDDAPASRRHPGGSPAPPPSLPSPTRTSKSSLFGDDDDDDDEDEEDSGGFGQDVTDVMLTYDEALMLAQQGRSDDRVLEAFRAERKAAEASQSTPRLVSILVNLAAVLLDLGNRSPTPEGWTAKYKECIQVAKEALALDPENEPARANVVSGEKNLGLRGTPAANAPPPPPPPPRTPSPPASSRGAELGRLREPACHGVCGSGPGLFDDDDDEDDDELFSRPPPPPKSQSSTRPPAGFPEDEDEDEDEDGRLLRQTHMTYDQAIQLARERKVDKTVLAVMRREVEYAKELSGPERVASLQANLAAALLDMANQSPTPEEFTKLYKETEKVSLAALKNDPGNDAAQNNLNNARNNLKYRLGDAPPPPSRSAQPAAGKSLFEDDDDDDDQVIRTVSSSGGAAAGRRKNLFDDDDDEDDGQPPAMPPQLSYLEALQKAQRRNADPSVLAAFRREHEEAAAEANGEMTPRLMGIKINLGAVLVDLANKWPDPTEGMAMYKECEQLSLEVLEVSAEDSSAKSNLDSARKNLRIQDPRLSAEPGPEGPFTLTRAICEGLEVPLDVRQNRAVGLWTSHFSGETRAGVAEIQEALAAELAECGPRAHTLVKSSNIVEKFADTDHDGFITPAELGNFFGGEGPDGFIGALRDALTKPPEATLMLVMVIKNEREHLERSLPKWAPLVDFWLIGIDDKNTDGSEELIQKTLGHIPGELMKVEFDGMGPTLTQLVRAGLTKYPNATHGILADADFTPISTPQDWSKHELDMMASKHSFTIWNEKGKEWRRMDWIYRNIPGVTVIRRTHQTVEVPSIPGQLRYTKEITFQVREYTGGYQDRSGKKQETYIRWLEKDLEEMPGDGRTVYYLAVAHLLAFMSGPDPHEQVRNNGPNLKHALEALRLFRECSGMETASGEQRYFALTEAAQLCERYLNRFKEAEEDFLKAAVMDPVRADAWHGVGDLHRKQGQYSKAIPYLRKAAALVMPKRHFGQNEYLYICTRHVTLGKAVSKAKKATAADIADARQSLLIARAKCGPEQQHEVEELMQSLSGREGSLARNEL